MRVAGAASAVRRLAAGCATATFPRSAAIHPPAIRLERAIRDLYGFTPIGAPDTRGRGSITAPGACARRSAARSPTARRDPADVRLPAGARRGAAPDSGRPGACRHHRARPFPLHRQRRDRGAAGGAARLRPQGHRRAARPTADIDQAARIAARVSGDSTVAYSFAFARAVEAALGIEPPRARQGAARRDGRARAHRQPSRRHRRDLQRRLLRAASTPIAASSASACWRRPTARSATG